MIEEIIGGFIGFIWWLLRELFLGKFCFYIGWPICKILTLGRYPAKGISVSHDYSLKQESFLCILVGATTIIFIVILGINWLLIDS